MFSAGTFYSFHSLQLTRSATRPTARAVNSISLATPIALSINTKTCPDCSLHKRYGRIVLALVMTVQPQIDGQLTLVENIADNGALTIAYQLFQSQLSAWSPSLTPISIFNHEQRFFIALAQVVFCCKSNRFSKIRFLDELWWRTRAWISSEFARSCASANQCRFAKLCTLFTRLPVSSALSHEPISQVLALVKSNPCSLIA